jgi:hypothetical protein
MPKRNDKSSKPDNAPYPPNTAVHNTPELGISSHDEKGILQGTHESKLFDNWTLHMVLVRSNIAPWGVEGDERALWIRLTQPGPCCLIASQANCKSPGRSSRSTVNAKRMTPDLE